MKKLLFALLLGAFLMTSQAHAVIKADYGCGTEQWPTTFTVVKNDVMQTMQAPVQSAFMAVNIAGNVYANEAVNDVVCIIPERCSLPPGFMKQRSMAHASNYIAKKDVSVLPGYRKSFFGYGLRN